DLTVTGVQTCALPIYVKVGEQAIDDLKLIAWPDEERGFGRSVPHLPVASCERLERSCGRRAYRDNPALAFDDSSGCFFGQRAPLDRKSTRLNSSHSQI